MKSFAISKLWSHVNVASANRNFPAILCQTKMFTYVTFEKMHNHYELPWVPLATKMTENSTNTVLATLNWSQLDLNRQSLSIK